ncbi:MULTISPECIES: hypothetical protein [Gammaproteobacteria]|uniref:hypothetical protein n=1 Tax=Gammaproteobacteria TaxID=1236 RepID=UPI000DD0B2CE|nr:MULTISPECIES: hypothetical protein [Gammaproteobacteria]RTE85729.1 hypothetical protein DQX04_09770 [Aliidiomarina sp. B3213]TCZ90269.1 hypothetical protein EYQ95_10685 [Lysobacter sp. N42]
MKLHDFEHAIEQLKSKQEQVPDLWDGIESKLEDRGTHKRSNFAAIAASIVTIAFVGVIATVHEYRDNDVQMAEQSPEFLEQAVTQRAHEITVARLQRDIELLQKQLPSDASSMYGDISLQNQEFERAARDVALALQNSPGNKALEELLIYTYRQQLAWTQTMLRSQTSLV